MKEQLGDGIERTACCMPPPYEPTPEQIGAACLEIQAGWSDEERQRRWLGPGPVPVDESRRYKFSGKE